MSKDPQMERNYWLALVLSMAVIMAYPLFLRKMHPVAPPQANEAPLPNESVPAAAAPMAAPSAQALEITLKPIAPSIIQYANDLYDLKFSTLGATIVEMNYKGEKTKAHLSYVPFYSGEPSEPGIFGMRLLHEEIDLTRAVFKLTRKGARNEIFEFVYEKPGDYRFTKEFVIESERPVILLKVSLEDLSGRERHFPLEIVYGLDYADSAAPHHMDVEAVMYQEKVKSAKLGTVLKKGFLAAGSMDWTGLLKKYFAILVKPDWKIISDENKADAKTLWSVQRLEPVTVAPSGKTSQELFIYAGPQRYETLKNLKMDFEEILSKGFFGLFKIWLLIALKFLNQFTHNFGWAIILLTLALKIAFTPLTHMSYESMRRMQAVQPKLKSIQERYKKDPAKLNREMMELYRRNKVNPMGGCLPMLAQIPIFIAFYQVLNETIELKGAPFIFWIQDLAEPDKLFHFPFSVPFVGDAFNLLPLFMIGSMLWQQKLTPQPSTSNEQAQAMKFMPVIFGFLFYKMPSGLVLYWFVNNMLTIFHQLVIKRMGDVVLHHEDRE